MTRRSMLFNSAVLGAFAFTTAFLLAGTHLGTRDKIAEAERRAAEKALLEIIPRHAHSNDMLMDTIKIPEAHLLSLGLPPGSAMNMARQNGKVSAVIVPAIAADGYSGAIKLIVGINIDGSIAGVRVLAHNETPGLGDKVDLKKSDWILSFNGKSLARPLPHRWQVKKDGGDFDQFTGATITPRAVVNQVRKTLEYFAADATRLLQIANVSTSGNTADSEKVTGTTNE